MLIKVGIGSQNCWRIVRLLKSIVSQNGDSANGA